MKTLLVMIKKEFIRFFNDKTAMLLTFIVPAVLIFLFGNIFGGAGAARGKASVLFVNESSSLVAKFLEQKLDSCKAIKLEKTFFDETLQKEIPYNDSLARKLIKEGEVSAAIVFPVDFFADTSSGIKINLYYDPKNEIEMSLIQGAIQQSIMGEMSKLFPVLMQRQTNTLMGEARGSEFMGGFKNLLSQYAGVDFDSIGFNYGTVDSSYLFSNDTAQSANAFMNNMISFNSEQLVGEEIENPQVTRIVGGWAMMFLLFSLSGAATSFFEEKSEGTLKRILCMPVQRNLIIWSKFIYSVLLGFVQLSVLFVVSWILFDVDIFSNVGNLIIVIFVSASAAVAFGMLITVLSDTINQASGYSTFLILVMSAVGGAWFPTFFFPDWLQIVSKFTLVYWSVEAFQNVLWRQSSFMEILPHLLVLSTIAIVVNAYAIYRFKTGKMLR